MKKRYLVILFLFYQSLLFSCDDILAPFKFECMIQDEYRNLKNNLEKKDIEFLSNYRISRFIYEKKNEINRFPWEIKNPNSDKWIFWELGNHLLKVKFGTMTNKQIQLKIEFLDFLKKLSFSYREKYNTPKFGKLRNLGSKPFICVSLGKAEIYQRLKNFEFKFKNGSPIISLSKISPNCPSEKQIKINFPGGEEAALEFDRFWNFAQMEHQNILNKTGSISPYELMAYLQKWYLAIHPFEDGVGMTAKFLLDMFSYIYDLPYIPDGGTDLDFSTPIKIHQEQTKKNIKLMISEIKTCLDSPELSKCKNIYDIQRYSSSPKSIKEFINLKEVFFEKCFNKLKEPCYQLSHFDYISKLNIKTSKRHPYQLALDGRAKECQEILSIDDFKKNRKTNLIEFSLDNLELISAKEKKCSMMLSKDELFALQSFTSEKKITEESQAGQDEGFVNMFDEPGEGIASDDKESNPSDVDKLEEKNQKYKKINRMARLGRRTKEIDNLYLGLKKVTRVSGNIPLWRGMNKDPKLKVGGYLKNNFFMSTSALMSVASNFAKNDKDSFKKKIFMKIVGHFSGKSIMTLSNFPEEMEIIFLPGSSFKILSKEENEASITYNLLEI